MDRALPLAASVSPESRARGARRTLPEVLFASPWAALAIPLLIPLVFLFA
jgi:hypothetical protein